MTCDDIDRITKVEKKYYADGEDAYEMMKFFKEPIENKIMKKITEPITSTYPGATYPLIAYPSTKGAEVEKKSPPLTEAIPHASDAKPDQSKETNSTGTDGVKEAKKEEKKEEGKKKKKHKKKK